jgi:hypothetical protein
MNLPSTLRRTLVTGVMGLALVFPPVANTAEPRPPLKGGVEKSDRERQREGYCARYADSYDSSESTLEVMPKGGRTPGYCQAPRPNWTLLGEEGNYCCFFAPRDWVIKVPPLPGNITQDQPLPDRRPTPDDRKEYPKPPPTDPTPPTAPPEEDGYWAGVKSGLSDCGETLEVMLQAFEAMRRNDFITAASLLGATESDAWLRSLAQQIRHDFTEVRVLDERGHPLSEFEKGKRQAQRVCLYGILPKAQRCAARATECAVRGTTQACGKLIRRVTELPPVRLKLRLPPPSDPRLRGMLLADETFLKRLAMGEGKVFIVRDSNQFALRWIGRDGYRPKPLGVKGKTLKPADLEGNPSAQANPEKYLGLASAKGMSIEARTDLLNRGYKISSPGDMELITGPDGRRFYSDVDLHGVYEANGRNGWTAALQDKLNCQFVERMLQHGPQDLWPDRNNRAVAGPNYGPQVGGDKSLTAILPDGNSVHIKTLPEMKAFYGSIGVDWRSIYPNH